MAGELLRGLQHSHLLAVVAHGDLFADRNLVRRNVYLASIHGYVAMPNQLSSLAARNRKAQAIDNIVQSALELLQQLCTGHALSARGLFKVVAELLFQREVNALSLLLLTELQSVANDLGFAVFAMLSGSEVALFDRALVAETLGALEKEFHAFASAKAANWSFISCHCFSKPRVLHTDRFTGGMPFFPI